MRNPFRTRATVDRTGGPPPTPPAPNRIDDLATALKGAGRVPELERELRAIDPASLSPAEQASWWHLYGIAAFQTGREAEALARFQEAHRRFPDSPQIRFSLGQQLVRARDLEKGFSLFRSCRFPEVPREFVMAQARYAYLCNRHEDGRLFVRPFFEAYRQLKILDDHFLYVRGLPFFGRAWGHLAAFCILSGDLEELETVTRWVAENGLDYDVGFLQAELAAGRDDNPGLLLEALEKRLGGLPEESAPSGYTRLCIAVAKARTAETRDAAETALSGVTLTGQDVPWLEDIRTLAQAETARRFGFPADEDARVRAFLARQPMLFEPDIALTFHLLRYQELLKPRVAWP